MAGLISGRNLMERLGIGRYELLPRLIKKGLIVYNVTKTARKYRHRKYIVKQKTISPQSKKL